MSLFIKQNITLHSGQKSDFKIECDSLTDEDIETIAYLISKKFNFYEVRGVPFGGIRLQKALEKYIDPNSSILLIADDVLTTGNSMEEFKSKIIYDKTLVGKIISDETIAGVVIFSRADSNFKSDWIFPLFEMNAFL